MAHTRQSRLDSSLGFQVKVLTTFKVIVAWQIWKEMDPQVASSLGLADTRLQRGQVRCRAKREHLNGFREMDLQVASSLGLQDTRLQKGQVLALRITLPRALMHWPGLPRTLTARFLKL